MSKRLTVAALALGALALPAPAAVADQPRHECTYDAIQKDTVTGPAFRAVLAGAIVHEGPVSIRCRLEVNGVTQAEVYAAGETVAGAAKDISYVADDGDVVRVCADYTSNHGSGTECGGGATNDPFPPDVVGTADEVLAEVSAVIDPPVCAILKSLAPGADPIFINGQGDVYVAGEPQWDCPPYDIVWW